MVTLLALVSSVHHNKHAAHLIVACNKLQILSTRIQVLAHWYPFAMISTVECQNLQTNKGECLPFMVQEDHRVHCQR